MYFWRVGGKFVSLALDVFCSFHMKTALRSAFTNRNAVLKHDRALETDTPTIQLLGLDGNFQLRCTRSSICCIVEGLHCISMHFYPWLSVFASPAFP